MKAKIIFTAIMALTIGVGCAKKDGSAPAAPAATETTPGAPTIPNPTGPYVPPTTGVGQDPGNSFTFGGTTDFTFENVSTYRQYTQRYINNLSELTNIKLNLNFDRFQTKYGGTATIRYTYQGLVYEGFFTGGQDAAGAKYNVWYTDSGKKVFHAFFEDFMGAIILVIDQTASLDDGYQPGDKVGGTIYFKNFPQTGAPHPPTYCWYVSLGPYDCRAWKSGNAVDTYKSVHPGVNDGYTKLGSFSNMDIDKAFNGDVQL